MSPLAEGSIPKSKAGLWVGDEDDKFHQVIALAWTLGLPLSDAELLKADDNLSDAIVLAEGCIEYLNFAAPKGYLFDWFQGSLYMWPFEWWDRDNPKP